MKGEWERKQVQARVSVSKWNWKFHVNSMKCQQLNESYRCAWRGKSNNYKYSDQLIPMATLSKMTLFPFKEEKSNIPNQCGWLTLYPHPEANLVNSVSTQAMFPRGLAHLGLTTHSQPASSPQRPLPSAAPDCLMERSAQNSKSGTTQQWNAIPP